MAREGSGEKIKGRERRKGDGKMEGKGGE